MGLRLSAPGPHEKRFAAYMDGLADAAGHEDRHAPLRDYCKGLFLPGERKSIEPMAPQQSLHHLVTEAPRLPASFGAQRDRYPSAAEMQQDSGIAPVLARSGKTVWVRHRWTCPKFLRQTFHEWAGHAIAFCGWARATTQPYEIWPSSGFAWRFDAGKTSSPPTTPTTSKACAGGARPSPAH